LEKSAITGYQWWNIALPLCEHYYSAEQCPGTARSTGQYPTTQLGFPGSLAAFSEIQIAKSFHMI
jgi:hypothetical protein